MFQFECPRVIHLETDRNSNFRYLPKPNILHLQNAKYSAETEYSVEYLIFFKIPNIRQKFRIFFTSTGCFTFEMLKLLLSWSI